MEAAGTEGAEGGADCSFFAGWTVSISFPKKNSDQVLTVPNSGTVASILRLVIYMLNSATPLNDVTCTVPPHPHPTFITIHTNTQSRVLYQTRHPRRRRRRSHHNRLLPRNNLAASYPAQPQTPPLRSLRFLPSTPREPPMLVHTYSPTNQK
jgi:hypothetical protein